VSRYLVTGATGFLGAHLVEQLRAHDHQVVALCRKQAPAYDDDGVTVRFGDVTDGGSVRDAADGCDGAFHCAGLVSRHQEDADAMYRVHVEGTKATLDALREAGVGRVVVTSTSGTIAVSNDADAIATEDDPAPAELITRWPYYRSKFYAEQAALARNRGSGDDGGLEVVCVNPSLLLGPGDLRGSSTEDVRKFLERKIPFCPGGGIAFVDARDAASGMLLAMSKGEPGRRYLLNAANMTIEAFFGRLSRISGVKAPPLSLPRTSVTLAGLSADFIGRAAKMLNMESPLDRVSAEMAQYFCWDGRAATPARR